MWAYIYARGSKRVKKAEMLLLNFYDVEIDSRNHFFLYDVSYPSLHKESEEVVRKVVEDQTMVDIYIARLNFLGLPRSGKSTTMKRLIGE